MGPGSLDQINYYAYELTKERIDYLARLITVRGGEVTSREFLDIHTLAFALEGLVEDDLQLSEDALRDMHERLRGRAPGPNRAWRPAGRPKV